MNRSSRRAFGSVIRHTYGGEADTDLLIGDRNELDLTDDESVNKGCSPEREDDPQ